MVQRYPGSRHGPCRENKVFFAEHPAGVFSIVVRTSVCSQAGLNTRLPDLPQGRSFGTNSVFGATARCNLTTASSSSRRRANIRTGMCANSGFWPLTCFLQPSPPVHLGMRCRSREQGQEPLGAIQLFHGPICRPFFGPARRLFVDSCLRSRRADAR